MSACPVGPGRYRFGVTGTPQEAAARLAAAGITWEHHTRRVQKRDRFVDPRNPIIWVEQRGLLVSFAGVPVDPVLDAMPHAARTLLTGRELRRVIAQLKTLPMLTDSVVPLTPYRDPNVMVMFEARNLAAAIEEVRWERAMLGDYRLPMTADLVRDLAACLEVEAAMLALAGDTTN